VRDERVGDSALEKSIARVGGCRHLGGRTVHAGPKKAREWGLGDRGLREASVQACGCVWGWGMAGLGL
jgi:hypothetical protein